MRKLFSVVVLVAGLALGQSSMMNPVYNPQPRILIPHVEAPSVLVDTNGTITANPYRNLKYCDFVLKAISQKSDLYSTYEIVNNNGDSVIKQSPCVYLYASAQQFGHSFEDSDVSVFYQDTGSQWPGRVLRIAQISKTTSNIVSIITNDVFESWSLHLSATNYPDSVNIGGIPTPFHSILDGWPQYWRTNYPQARVYVANGNSWVAGFMGGDGIWRSTTVWAFGNIASKFLEAVSSPEPKGHVTGFQVTTNWAFSPGGPLQVISGNRAVAIEVYPSISKYLEWMRPGNPDVKWMCLLSNGIDFYRDPQSGEPMWFNVDVEWVDRVPEEGVWSN